MVVTGELLLSFNMWWFYSSLLVVVGVESLSVPYVSSSSSSSTEQGSSGNPLFLTPFLEKGEVTEARKLSEVRSNVKSYSGYLTVDKKCESNLFFWFFPAQKSWKRAPVVLWLQGGPGASSLFGLFEEIGPFSFENRLKRRKFSWNVENNLLFIDQPVGTGFSFTRQDCYASNETQVSEQLFSALVQFYQLFPEITTNKFFLTGESYAGTYIPAIGYKIHQSNRHSDFKINLRGMMIGNGWMDEHYQGNTSEYLFQIGLGDFNARVQPEGIQNSLRPNLLSATRNLKAECDGYDPYNYMKSNSGSLDFPFATFLDLQEVRKSIHVGNESYEILSEIVNENMNDKNIKIKKIVEELLEHYPIVFYNGQLDTVCPYPLLVKFLRALDWSGAADYETASRHKWCEDGVLAGYRKSARNLHEVMVRAAGHMVPQDQPSWAFKLVHSLTNNPPANPLASLANC